MQVLDYLDQLFSPYGSCRSEAEAGTGNLRGESLAHLWYRNGWVNWLFQTMAQRYEQSYQTG